MAPRIAGKSIEKSRYINYKTIAQDFRNGALNAAELEYYNAAGVLIVHAAIALADAVTIKTNGIKSKGENHDAVVQLLDSKLPSSEEKKKALFSLGRIIEQKNKVSYMGIVYYKKDVSALFKYYERFQNWTDSILQ
jgi:hypothetical protein